MNTQSIVTVQTSFEREVAERLVEALQLEVMAEEIHPEAPLFGEGLGLDSIDALEIVLMMSRDYGVTLRSDDPNAREIFRSLRTLCHYVAAHRQPS